RPEPPEPRHAAVRAVPPVICRRLSRIAGLLLERGQDLCASRVEVAKRSLGGVAALVAAARKQKTRACERENQEKKPKNSAEEIGGESPDWLREAAGLQVVRLPAFLGSRRNAPMDNSAVEG